MLFYCQEGKKLSKKGLFITFEGVDGSGKSTQLELTKDYLRSKNIDFIVTRNPGGTDLGVKLREILLNYDGNIAPLCELFLYLGDMAQNIEETIIPSLNEGKIVICDRYIDSTIAYQGCARGLAISEIININKLIERFLTPDLTLIYDLDLENAAKRISREKDRLESESLDFHIKVKNGYLDLAQKYPERIKVIDSNKSIEEVFAETKKIIDQKLS